MATNEAIQEEVHVIFHAALVGRTDIIKNAIESIRETGDVTEEQIKELLSTVRAEDHASPLHIAAAAGHSDVIRALLTAGADPRSLPTEGEYAGKFPYQVANDTTKETFHVYMFEQIAMGHATSIDLLMKSGIPANLTDDSPLKDSGLHWAASFGSYDVAVALLLNGADVNLKNSSGQTPLHVACKSYKKRVIELFLSEGAQSYAKDNGEKTPLMLLPTSVGEEDEVFKLVSSPPEPTFSLKTQFLAAEKKKKDEEELQKKIESHVPQEVCDPGDEESEDSVGEDSQVLLVFWPPVKQQFRNSVKCLEMRSDANLLICVANSEIDVFPLLTRSGLMDVLDLLGFQAQVKRSSLGAKIRVCVDKNICPARHSYELQVRPQQLVLVGSDAAGLLYGLYSLIQLLQLHSEVEMLQNNENEDDDGKSLPQLTIVRVPTLKLTDRPDVPDRAVLWSFRNKIRTSASRMRDQVELLSRLRFNLILLVVDSDTENNEITNTKSEESIIRVYALDDICKQICIDLVPTIIITSLNQSLPVETLRNFSCKMVAIVFQLSPESIIAELKKTNTIITEVTTLIELLQDTCSRVLGEVQVAGYSSLILVGSEWVNTNVDLMSLASDKGLFAIERDLNLLFPKSLFSKPFLSTQSYCFSLQNYAHQVDKKKSSIAVFPAFMERDFLFPSMLLKFYCFMFSGYIWNLNSSEDMLGDAGGSYDGSMFSTAIVREVMTLLLFPLKAGSTRTEQFSTALNLFTGDKFKSEITGGLTVNETYQTLKDLNLAEISIWSLLVQPAVLNNRKYSFRNIPTKFGAAQCLKLYRRLINLASYKPQNLKSKQSYEEEMRNFISVIGTPKASTSQEDLQTFNQTTNGAKFGRYGYTNTIGDDPKQTFFSDIASVGMSVESLEIVEDELEELFSVINMMSVVSKLMVLSYKSYEKKLGKSVNSEGFNKDLLSERVIIETLPVGTKSDVANSLLESLDNTAAIWKKRYDRHLLQTFKHDNSLLECNKKVDESSKNGNQKKETVVYTSVDLMKMFLERGDPAIPGAALFSMLSEKLPLPPSVTQFIERLFSR